MILSLLPIVIPLAISLGAALGLIPVNPSFSRRLPIILSILFAIALCVVLWKWASLEKEGLGETLRSTEKDERVSTRIQRMMLFVSAFIGIFVGLFVLDPSYMRYTFGIVLMLFGLVALASRIMFPLAGRIDNAIEAKQDRPSQSGLPASLSQKKKFVLLQTAITIAALAVVVNLGFERYLSYWDLLGFLFFSVSFGIWFWRE